MNKLFRRVSDYKRVREKMYNRVPPSVKGYSSSGLRVYGININRKINKSNRLDLMDRNFKSLDQSSIYADFIWALMDYIGLNLQTKWR